MDTGGRKALLIIGAICAVVALGYWPFTLSYIDTGLASEDWPVVRGRIVELDGSRASKRVKVVYEYAVDGRRYTSDHLSVATTRINLSHPNQYDTLAAKYPEGSTVDVHYDPADPSRAVLEPGVGSQEGGAPFVTPLIGSAGVGMLLAGLPLRLSRQVRRLVVFGLPVLMAALWLGVTAIIVVL